MGSSPSSTIFNIYKSLTEADFETNDLRFILLILKYVAYIIIGV